MHARRASVLLLTIASTLNAQSTRAELLGTLLDPAGAPIPAAIVELRSTTTALTITQATTPAGTFHFLALPPGDYRIQVAKDGFSPLKRDGILLRVGDRLDLTLNLNLGDAAQTIEVTAAPALLQTTRATVGFVVEQRKIINLPLDGRNFVPLIALAPGVNLPVGNLFPRINGSRPRVSEYIYDGISVLQPEPGQVAFYPVVDAIEEFRVETNSYSAEYGRSNGGVIMVNQKAGTNEFHGTLFDSSEMRS